MCYSLIGTVLLVFFNAADLVTRNTPAAINRIPKVFVNETDSFSLGQIVAPTYTIAVKLTVDGNDLIFNYGKSYLVRNNAIAVYNAELALQAGALPLLLDLSMPGCIRDASPDAWGRRVIINKKLGLKGTDADSAQLDELTYLLESGSDRIGALDFQYSATEYLPRCSTNMPLDELLKSAERVKKGEH